jgi:hypothetical protein
MDICEDAGKEQVARSNGREEYGQKREFFETAGDHPDKQCVGKKEEDRIRGK